MNNEYWVNDDGVDRKATPDEIAEYERLQSELSPPAPSLEDEVAQLKQENTSLRNDLDEMTLLMADMIGGAV